MSERPTTDRRWPQFTLTALFALVSGVALAIVIGPIATLVLLYVAFFASLRFSSKRLPDVVRDMQGRRVSRQVYQTAMLFVGLWGPLFPAGLILVCMSQEMPANLVSYVAWAACVLLVIVIAAHWKTVSDNTHDPIPESATH